VPRLYNKIYAKIKATFDEMTGCKAFLINSALASKTANLHANATYTHGCYDFLVFKKIKAMMGGKVQFMVTGSAPIKQDVLAFLKVCFACPILEGYGLSETSAAASATAPADPNLGHVGGPIRCCKMRLKDVPEMNYFSTDSPFPRGEVQMKGPNVFSGYYNMAEKTKESFDAQGWFCSGDVGVAYPNGSIAIIDRAKQIFKLSQGEYVAPAKLEEAFGMSPLIGQCFVYGTSLKSNTVMVVTLDEGALAWAKKNGKPNATLAELAVDPAMKKAILEDMKALAKENGFNSVETPRDIFVTDNAFTVENDCVTPTFKMKRNGVQALFQKDID